MPDQPQSKIPEPDKIGVAARIWRAVDKEAIANKNNPGARAAEYRARQELRKVVDEAGEA